MLRKQIIMPGLEIFFLSAGTLFAWYTVIRQFRNFYLIEGTLFKISSQLYRNPVTTPCFYGAIGFVIALVWLWVLLKKGRLVGSVSGRYHIWFLFAGTLFAWGNVSFEWWQIHQAAGQPVVGCSGLMTSIFQSPCFYGAVFFLLSLLTGWLSISKNKLFTS